LSNYTKSTNFATKDNLTPGDPLKIVRGTEIDTEFNNIATAIATKTDNASAAITGGTINDTTIGATTASTGAFTTISATGAITSTLATGTAPLVVASTTKVTNLNVDSLDGADWASPAALGSTTPAAVSATTLSASGNVTLSGGTANGVAYLNGSKVVTSGSALVFDGSNLGLGVTPSAWGSNCTAFQVEGAALSRDETADARMNLSNNAYRENGSVWKYIGSFAAVRYEQGFTEGAHRWYTAPSGTAGNAITFTQAMTLDASGFLGVGETSPTSRIHANGTIQARTGATGIQIYGDGGSGYVNSVGANPLIFQVNSSERARIDSSGDFLVGSTSSTGERVQFLGTAGAGTMKVQVGADGNNGIGFRNASGTTVGSITVNSSTTSYNTSSDERLKQNIQDAYSASSLIDSLQVRQYDWKTGGLHQRYGFVAQELVTVAPEAVHQPADPEEMMAVDYSKLVPMLVKEVQSLRKRLADAGI
jgi:hypothetical protein